MRAKRARKAVNYSLGEDQLSGDDHGDADFQVSSQAAEDLAEDDEEMDVVSDDASEVKVLLTEKKVSKKGRKPKVTKASETNDSTVRGKKMESLRDRFWIHLGGNDERIVTAIKERTKWGKSSFSIDSNLLNSSFSCDAPPVPLLAQEHVAGQPIRSVVSSAQFMIGAQATPFQLEFLQTKSISDVSFLIHTKFPVTNVKWAPGITSKDSQLLALTTLDDPTVNNLPLKSAGGIVVGERYALSTSGGESKIWLLKVNLIEAKVELKCTLGANHGLFTSISWRPDSNSDVQVGVLATLSQDGAIRVFVITHDMIDNDSTKNIDFKSPQMHFGLPTKKITCFTWRTPEIISFGTADGFIGEFNWSAATAKGSLDGLDSLSFLSPLLESVVTSVVSAYPDYPQLVYARNLDCNSILVDVDDIRRARTYSQRIRSLANGLAYSSCLDSFVTSDERTIARLIPLRHPSNQANSSPLTQHNGGIMAIASSHHHPMVISASSDGSVRIGNVYRKALVSKRAARDVYKQGLLFKVDVSEIDNIIRVSDYYQIEDINAVLKEDTITTYPAAASISSLDFCQEGPVANYFAVGMMCGLVRVECLT